MLRLLPLSVLVLFGFAAPLATAQSTLFFESFDTVLAPDLPPGWADPDGTWMTSSSAASSGSGGNNLVSAGAQGGLLTMPPVDLSGVTSATLRYLARRTGTYDQAALSVRASTDGGITFPVALLPSGSALPAATSSYEEIAVALPAALLGASQVVLRFEAAGGSTGSANIRLDDVALTGVRAGTAGGDQFGFAAASSTALEESNLIEIPLVLSATNDAGLQGLQLSVAWDDAAVDLVGVARGPAVADAGRWTLSFEAGEAAADVVLLGDAGSSLQPGLHDPLLILQLRSGTVAPQDARDIHLVLSRLIGALAVAAGADAGLVPSIASHTLTLERRKAFFEASTASLDVGATGASLRVSNPGGTRSLAVHEVTSSDPQFTVSPAAATVPPGGEQVFIVTFTAAPEVAGPQEAVLSFTHDGEGGPAFEVAVTGAPAGSRGDVDGDGGVDVLDLVLTIDFILSRTEPDDRQQAAVDLFPFPEGDGVLDVRDLTVLVHALGRGRWPDEVALSSADGPGGTAPSKHAAPRQADVEAHLTAQGDGLALHLSHEIPLRAFQLVLEVEDGQGAPTLALDSARAATVRSQSGFDAETGVVRLILFRPDGEAMPPGRYLLASIPQAGRGGVTVRTATAVDAGRARVPVTVHPPQPNGPADEPVGPEHAGLGQPYPNPFHAAGGALQVPVQFKEAGEGRLAVYDVLGRHVATLLDSPHEAGRADVTWDGRDHQGWPVAPGLYLFRMTAGTDHVETRTVVVVR